MIDLHLRADDENTLIRALPFLRERDGWLQAGRGFALDMIGHVVIKRPVTDRGGAIVRAAEIDTRFHANLRCTEEVAALVPRAVVIAAPATPYRVWFAKEAS